MIHFLSETKAVAGAARVPCPGVAAAQTLHAGKAVLCALPGALAARTAPWDATCGTGFCWCCPCGPEVQESLHSPESLQGQRGLLALGTPGTVLVGQPRGRSCLLGQAEPVPSLLAEVAIPSSGSAALLLGHLRKWLERISVPLITASLAIPKQSGQPAHPAPKALESRAN